MPELISTDTSTLEGELGRDLQLLFCERNKKQENSGCYGLNCVTPNL